MALRLRRGTDSQRQLITPVEGEMIYTTDTRELYVGDGDTVGGIKISGEIPTELSDLSDIDITNIEPILGQILRWDGEKFVPSNDEAVNEGENYYINISKPNSSLIVDATNSLLYGDLVGNVTGDVVGNLSGSFTGSVFANDSTLIIDGETGSISSEFIQGTLNNNVVGDLTGSVIGLDSNVIVDASENIVRTDKIFSNVLSVFTQNNSEFDFGGARSQLRITDTTDTSTLRFNYERDIDLSSSDTNTGQIWFERSDPVNDSVITSFINGGTQSVVIGVDNSGSFSEIPFFRVTTTGIGFGNSDPAQALDIDGNAVISGEVNAAAFKGTLVGDDSSIIVDAANGEILAPIRDIEVVGATDNGSSVTDTVNPVEWLQITVNGSTRYIPLHV